MNSQRRAEATQDRSWPAVGAIQGPADLQEPVEIGSGIRLGGASVPVFAGSRRGADAVHVSLVEGVRPAGQHVAAQLDAVRDLAAGPLVVSGMTADTAPVVARYADAVLVEGSALDGDLSTCLSGLAVLRAGDLDWPLARWRTAIQAVSDAGATPVALVRPATTASTITDSASIRLATGAPVVIDVGTEASLVAHAVAAGADGIWLSEHADEMTVATARDVVARLAPTVRQVSPGTLPECREAIDRVDAALASLLEYRASLAARVQTLKPVSGHAGRDAAREAEIVRGMAVRAPSLGPDGLRRIVEAVITAGLDAAARNRQPDPPMWRL